MDGTYLSIFTTEKRKHDGMLLYEWLLEQARGMGIGGGSAVRAIAGYGRHKRLHEEAFYELASDLPVEVIFVLPQDQADKLTALISKEGLSLLYVKSKVKWGYTGSN
jgi:PII-like signaling protein